MIAKVAVFEQRCRRQRIIFPTRINISLDYKKEIVTDHGFRNSRTEGGGAPETERALQQGKENTIKMSSNCHK